MMDRVLDGVDGLVTCDYLTIQYSNGPLYEQDQIRSK